MTPTQRQRLARVEAARNQPETQIACPACETGTLHIAPDGIGDHCDSCGYDSSFCPCGTRMVFDPSARGETCGHVVLVGWCKCPACPDAQYMICHLSQTADAVEWKLASSGRSLTAGGIKVRAEPSGEPGDIEALMARIVRVPELELELEQLRAELAIRRAWSSHETRREDAASAAHR